MGSLRPWLLLLAVTACTGDGGPQGPLFPALPAGETIVTTGYGALHLVDVRTGETRWVRDGGFSSFVVGPDGRTGYGALRRGNTEFWDSLVVLDLFTGETRWQFPIADRHVPAPVGAIVVHQMYMLGVSHDGSTVYTGYARRDSLEGLAALDVAEHQPVGFFDVICRMLNSPVSLPPSLTYPEGVVLVVGERRYPPTQPTTEYLYLLHPRTLAPLDSVRTLDVFQEEIWELGPTPDPNTLYLTTAQQVMRFDLVTKTVTASTPRRVYGGLAYTPGLRYVVHADGPSRFGPGVGVLYLYTEDLQPLGTIDLSTPLGGTPYGPDATVVWWSQVPSLDGRRLFLSGGVSSWLYGKSQPSRLLVVNLVERRLEGFIPFPGWPSVGQILRVRP